MSESNQHEREHNGTDPADDEGEAGPPDGEIPEDALATVEDFAVERGADDEILPVTEKLPGRDMWVEVRPLTQGEANEFLPDHGDPRGLDDDELLALLEEFYEQPDFSRLDSLDDMQAYGLDPLLKVLMDASGFDMTMGMVGESDEIREIVEGNMSGGN
jgi:hypothetical protein